MIDPEKLAEWRARSETATQPGPWTVYVNSDGTCIVLDANGMWVADCGHAPEDARFIAAAREAVPALLGEVGESAGYTLADRVKDVAHEAFGPFPVQTAEEALTAIERGIFEQRKRIAELEAQLAAAARRAHARAHKGFAP